MLRLIITFTVIWFYVGCSSDQEMMSSDTLIFGQFYGACSGSDCVQTFKIENNQLFEDSIDDYGQNNFDFAPRDQSDYDLVSDLVGLVPSQLLDESSQTFGCPDCADQGGLYIQIVSIDSEVINLEFRMDLDKNNVPEYLHSFIDILTARIVLLQ